MNYENDSSFFIEKTLAGTVTASLTGSLAGQQASRLNPKYAKLDEVLKQPVFKKEYFSNPVIIKSLELLCYNNSYLCRVRAANGAEGISAEAIPFIY